MHKRLCIAMIAILCATYAAQASAQPARLSAVGVRLGYVAAENLDGAASIGAQLDFARGGSRWHLAPGLQFWSSDGASDVNPNVDAWYHFNPADMVTPYLGAGLGLHAYHFDRRGSETDLGANLFGGLRFPGTRADYFLETRYTIADRPQFGLQGGVSFRL